MKDTTHLETLDGSCKFWEIEINDKTTTISQGKVGKAGTKREKTHASNDEAQSYYDEQVELKKSKGFHDTASTKRKHEESSEEPDTKRVRKAVTTKKAPKAKKAAKKAKANDDEAETKEEKEEKEEEEEEEEEKEEKEKPKKKGGATKKNGATAFVAPIAKPEPEIVITPPTDREVGKEEGPTQWRVDLGYQPAYGLHVDNDHVFEGNDSGLIQQFNKSGEVLKQYRVYGGVKCIKGDGPFLYVGCTDGSLYDITQGAPRLMSKVEEFSQVYSMDIHQGVIAASDKDGNVALINSEGETIWKQKAENGIAGWMCLKDSTGVYHGHSNGVTKRSLETGEVIWSAIKGTSVMFGQQDEKYVYASYGNGIYKLDKATGAEVFRFPTGGPSCAVSKDSNRIISSMPFVVYDSEGSKIDQYECDVGPASMAVWDNNEVYAVRYHLIKYDFSPEAVQKMKDGLAVSKEYAPATLKELTPYEAVTETKDPSGGIICECIKQDGKLRVRPVSSGYISSWNVQFPRAIREEGAKFVVEKLIDQGGFYRVWGDIKKVTA